MTWFVWTKMGSEAGQGLDAILDRKEAEREANGGVFWWGIGSSLGRNVLARCAEAPDGLDVYFSPALSSPRPVDAQPDEVWLWGQWSDHDGRRGRIPDEVVVTSRGGPDKGKHHALVCRSAVPLRAQGAVKLDRGRCRTVNGKVPGTSQVTALLEGDALSGTDGQYTVTFQAKLHDPYSVTLVAPRRLLGDEIAALAAWDPTQDWEELARRLRR